MKIRLPPALRFQGYRAFWMAMLASVSGFQILQFGQFWLIHELTGSPLFLGYVGAASATPAIVLNLFGGMLADTLHKGRLLVVTQSISAGLVFLLATITLLGLVRPEHVIIIAFFAGGVQAFDQPARQSVFPQLVDRSAMMNAVALNSSIWQGTTIMAPAVAGIIISVAGSAAAFYISGAGFVTMALVIWRLQIRRPEKGLRGSTVQEMLEGLSFIRKNSIFTTLIGMAFFNSFFGMSYFILMPVFAVDVLKVGADGQGVLLSVGGIGSLATTVWMSTRGTVRYKGPLLIGGAAMAGFWLAAFGLTSQFVGSYLLAIALMFVIGAFTSMYMISIQNALQSMVPDRLRGRVMGFYSMTWNILPLGGMQAGAIASVIGAPFAVTIGALAVAGFALGPALMTPRLRHLDAVLHQFEVAAPAIGQRPR